jgi:uncharacterized protein YbjT (DUF2867 family)
MSVLWSTLRPDPRRSSRRPPSSSPPPHATLQRADAGVQRIVAASIIGCDRFVGGYGAAKVAHEEATLAGPVPSVILRRGEVHEFVAQLVDWGRQGDVSYVPEMRTQLVAARTVAEGLVDLATARDAYLPVRSLILRGRAKRAWSRWPGCSSQGVVRACRSRA